MRTTLLAYFLIFFLKETRAQDFVANYYGSYLFETGSKKLVFSDTAFVRAQPMMNAAVQDTVFAFQPLRIVDTAGGLLTLGRKTAPWYRIAYTKNGKQQQGIIWGGALAISYLQKGAVQFACGLLSYPIPEASQPEDVAKDLQYINTFSIKAKDANGLQECRYNISRGSQIFYEETDSNGKVTDTHMEPAKGLPTGAKFLVRFNMSGEACGIPSYRILAAWDGRHLIRMPLLETNVDGGEWYYEDQYVYPNQKGGNAGSLMIRCMEETAIEGTEKMEKKISWKEYRYDEVRKEFRK